ncbi:MAG: dihydrolipoyllysine-residue succinyltransferase, partial [Bacteroidota bacterium]
LLPVTVVPLMAPPLIAPVAPKLMQEKELSEDQVAQMLKSIRIGKKDIEEITSLSVGGTKSFTAVSVTSRDIERKKMSMLRLKLAQRLVEVKNHTAMLTTFNEVDMSAILGIKAQYNDKFKEKYGFGVGFMSFFSKAVAIALQEFPMVNAQIDGEDLLIPAYVDLGIAVSAPKGLVVPVIRNAEALSIVEIEAKVKELAGKARNNKITLEEMSGGTFTITNGGVFGSMMSTPILNPPQSAILGMHNIVERPVAIHGKVEIRPIMYVALSYDHRVIDGRESVSFLVRVKEMLENPVKMLFGGKDPNLSLLGL